MPKALLRALSHAHEKLLPVKAACSPKRPLDAGTLTKAQMSMASQVGGTIKALTKKSQRIRCGDTSRNGNLLKSQHLEKLETGRDERTCISQYRK